jgi:hypothetical protein
MIERYNRTILNLVSILMEPYKNQRDWDTQLPYVGYAYRSAVQESTGETPNMLMMGREVATPLDLLVKSINDDEETTDYAQELREKLRSAHERARKTLQVSTRRQKKQYDRKAHGKVVQRGSFVWLYNFQRKPGVSKKLRLPWNGPYLVVTKLSDVHCRVQKSQRAKCKVVHVDRLKPYEGPELDSWLHADPGNCPVESPPDTTEIPCQNEKQVDHLFSEAGQEENRVHDSQPEITEDGAKSHQKTSQKLVNKNQLSAGTSKSHDLGEKPESQTMKPKVTTKPSQSMQNNGDRRNPHRERRLPARYK